jgi:predicted nucleic acid-binding protein
LRAAFDTNVMAYAEGIDEPERQTQALAFIRSVPADRFAVPVQVLGELFNVLVRKARFERAVARSVVLTWQESYPVLETSQIVMSRAVELAADHGLGIWDAVILSAASEGHCNLLLSEDMRHGFTWGGVTVINPFAPSPHRLLDDLRNGGR